MARPTFTASNLRDLITITRQVEQPNGRGGYETVPQIIDADVPAEVIGLVGREEVVARALQGIESYKVRVRWRDDVRQSDQIDYRGKTLNIRSAVDPEGRRRELVILADTEATLTA